MTAIITTEHLTKRYGSSRGIQGVTFDVQEGEVFGFLGPNGAGKTTTIRTLLGLLKPSAGRATIGGLDCWAQSTEVKRQVGYLPGEFTLDPALTGAQIIAYLGNLRGGVDHAYVTKLVERLELDPSKKFRTYSRGNKQKVGLVQAFMHHPRLLIMDEPTAGLDPLNQQEFYRMLAEAKAGGATAFLSSHNLTEVEHTCDRVGIIREGQLVKVGAVHTLKEIHHQEVEFTFPGQASADWFEGVAGVQSVTVNNGGHTARLTVASDLSTLLRVAAEHGATNVITREASLEEIFLRYYTPQTASQTASAAASS